MESTKPKKRNPVLVGFVDISPKGDEGVLKQILLEGTGTTRPTTGCRVQVHYVGTLMNGTQFDSSRERGEPLEFSLGKGNVIKAWDIGIATMLKGEISILTCNPEYAYGKTGNPPSIPPNATLKFEVEVIGWRGEDISHKKDGSIERYQMKAGEGYITPNEGALVDVHLSGSYEGRKFDERHVSFNIGEGIDIGIIEGIEKALEKFKKGEHSRIIIQPNLAFGAHGKPEWGIPSDAIVEYVITLKSFEKAKECWALDFPERVEQARIFKEKGTLYFKEEKYNLAIKLYKRILSFVEVDKGGAAENSELAEEQKSLLLSANLNLSLCYLKLEQYFNARDAATSALCICANEKAYFRRGQAHLALEEAKLALYDFHEVLKLQPDNKAAQAQMSVAQKMIKHQLSKEKQIYANMFDKFAKVDAQKEEEERRQQPDVMKTLGEWGEEERERAPTTFEKENPNILMLNGNGEFKDM